MGDKDENSGNRPSRRSVLKSLATSTTILGTIGTATVGATENPSDDTDELGTHRDSSGVPERMSSEDISAIEKKYATTDVVETAVTNAENIRSTLSEMDALDYSHLPSLEPTDLEPLARKSGSEGAAVQVVPDGDQPTYRVSVVAQTDRNAVQLFLYPETDRRYAVVEQPDERNIFLIENGDTVAVNALQTQSANTNSVTPQACHQSGYVCWGGCTAPQVMLYEYLWCDVALRCAVGAQVGCAPRRYYNCKTC